METRERSRCGRKEEFEEDIHVYGNKVHCDCSTSAAKVHRCTLSPEPEQNETRDSFCVFKRKEIRTVLIPSKSL